MKINLIRFHFFAIPPLSLSIFLSIFGRNSFIPQKLARSSLWRDSCFSHRRRNEPNLMHFHQSHFDLTDEILITYVYFCVCALISFSISSRYRSICCCSFRLSAPCEAKIQTAEHLGLPFDAVKRIKNTKADFKCTDFYQSRRICGAKAATPTSPSNLPHSFTNTASLSVSTNAVTFV